MGVGLANIRAFALKQFWIIEKESMVGFQSAGEVES